MTQSPRRTKCHGALLAALAGILLAGCLQAPGPAAPAPDATHAALVPWATDARVRQNATCDPIGVVFCVTEPVRDALTLQVPLNSTLEGLDLVLSWAAPAGAGPEPDVFWRLACGEDQCGGRILAQAKGKLPLHLAVGGLATPRGILLRSEIALEGMLQRDYDSRLVHQEGALTLRVDPSIVRAPDEVVVTPVSFSHTTGPCIYTDPVCSQAPYPRFEVTDLAGTIERLEFNITWQATTPASQVLELDLLCYGAGNTEPCYPEHNLITSGPSPLHVVKDDPGWPRGSFLHIWVHEVPPPGASTPDRFYVPTGQQFQLVGAVTARLAAEDQQS